MRSWLYFLFIIPARLIKDITSAAKPALVPLPSWGAAQRWGAQAAVTMGITNPWPRGARLIVRCWNDVQAGAGYLEPATAVAVGTAVGSAAAFGCWTPFRYLNASADSSWGVMLNKLHPEQISSEILIFFSPSPCPHLSSCPFS